MSQFRTVPLGNENMKKEWKCLRMGAFWTQKHCLIGESADPNDPPSSTGGHTTCKHGKTLTLAGICMDLCKIWSLRLLADLTFLGELPYELKPPVIILDMVKIYFFVKWVDDITRYGCVHLLFACMFMQNQSVFFLHSIFCC